MGGVDVQSLHEVPPYVLVETRQQLIEYVVAALAGGLRHDTRLLEEIFLNDGADDSTALRKLDFDKLKKEKKQKLENEEY